MFLIMLENTSCCETLDHHSFGKIMMKQLRSMPWGHILLAFAIICANKLGFNAWGGEEQYLAFARQFVNPEWIPGSFTLTEFAGSRVIFQWLIGPLMELFPFDVMVFSLRLINFILFSIPIGMLLKRLNLSLPFVFVLLQLFVMSEQNLFGGEWIIRSFEPKSLAYVFVFFALFHFVGREYWRMAIHLALASYFHILVGGWVVAVLGLVLLIEGAWKNAFIAGGVYIALMIPFLIYLLPGYFGSELPQTEVNLNWVYVYLRLPNHLGIWRTVEYFVNGHLYGAIGTAIVFMLGLIWKRWLPAQLQRLNWIMLVCFAINLLFLGIGAFDHFVLDNSGGLGLKFYPFRSSSLGMLMGLIIVLHFLWQGLKLLSFHTTAFRAVLLVVAALGVAQMVNNIKASVEYFQRDPDFRSMCAYIQNHTDKTDVFFVLAPDWAAKDYFSFNRRTERENYFVPKFVSAEKVKLAEWYERYMFYMQVRSKLDKLPEAHERYGVTYFLDGKERTSDYIKLEKKIGEYYLYKVLY